jgi:UDP-glucose 4-epimerase
VKVLVTGATGFVGRHLVPELARRHDVTCVVRRRPTNLDLGAAGTVEADLSDPGFGERLPRDVEVVVHLAQAYQPFPDRADELFGVNAASTQGLAEFARAVGARRFVLASSGSVYKPARAPLDEDSPTVPTSYHPATKLMAEMLLAHYRPYFTLAVLRLFAPYGPGQTDRLIPRMIESVRAGTPITLSRGGEPRINPIHIADLVRIVVQAVEDARSYTVNVAGPEAVSIRELAEIVGRLLGREPRFTDRDGEVAGDFVADTGLMHRLFSVGELTGLERGVGSMIGVVAPTAQ